MQTDTATQAPTEDQIRLIQSTWRALEPAGAQVGQLFYQRLFELDPNLRALFGADLVQQGDKLVAMLSAVVAGLGRLETLLPTVAELGRRHVRYGVTPAHYDSVGEALLWTLQRGLRQAATAPVMAAWSAAYGVLAAAMQAA